MQSPGIVFLVNGDADSAMAIRARSFAERLESDFTVHIEYRSANKIFAIFKFFGRLIQLQPALCYVLDMGFSGVVAAGLYRIVSHCRMVVDSGDAIYELSRSSGSRGPVGLWLTKLLEKSALSVSDRLVVRSHPHQELLARQGIRADVIPDGVDTREFHASEEKDLRVKYELQGSTVIGLLGSLIWNPRWGMCYGWELIEVLDRLRDKPVKGLIIGDGSGLNKLREQCSALGLTDRLLFMGRIPYHDLPQYLNLMDICLSTQTNDVPGQVRTTGKLPLYLACGRFVLASEVGEAARVLPPEMLVPYNGTKDVEYPKRLAERVQFLLDHPDYLQRPSVSVEIARAHFDYTILSAKLRQTVHEILPSRQCQPAVKPTEPAA